MQSTVIVLTIQIQDRPSEIANHQGHERILSPKNDWQ